MWPLTCVSRFPRQGVLLLGSILPFYGAGAFAQAALISHQPGCWPGGNLWPPYTQISTKLPSINMWGAAGPPWIRRLVHHHPPHRPPSHPPTNITLHPFIYLPSHPPHCPPLCHITKPQYVWGRRTAEDQETGDERMQMAAAYYGDRLLIDARLN